MLSSNDISATHRKHFYFSRTDMGTRKILWEYIKSNHQIIILVFIVCSLITSLSYSTSKFRNINKLHEYIISNDYKQLALLTACFPIPLVIDVTMDMYDMVINDAKVSQLYVNCFRLILVCSILIPNVIVYEKIRNNHSSIASVYHSYICAHTFRYVSTLCCVMAFTSKMVFQWNKYDHKILFMGVFMAIVMGILSQIFSIEAVRSNHLGYKCKYLAVIFLIFCNAANLLSGVVWFLMKQEVIMDTAYEYFTLSHIIYFNLYSIISLFSSLIITGDCVWAANKNQLIVEISAQLLLIVALTLIPGRTARIYAKETLYKMNEKLSFIRYISHEVRTPLNTAFLGLNHATIDVDGLQKKFPELLEIGAIRESLTDVHGACEVALSVINDLLTVDKLDSGKLTLQLEKINPIEFINDIFRSFKIVARQNDIVYTLDIDPSIRSWPIDRFISIDPYRFAQVIRNLISNAMKFTNAKGSVTIKVFMEQLPHSSQSADHSNLSSVVSVAPDIISLREGQLQRLRIEVVDTGAGISLENQKQLFTEYTQFHANRLQQGGGSGLGLWITKGIVQLHEGVVGATSQGEGKGSTFYVSIPIHRFEDISTRYGIIDGMNSERSSMKSFGDDAGIVSSSPVPDFADAAGFTSSKKRAIAQSSSIAGASLVELTNVGISNQQLVTDTEMQTILSAKRFHSSSIDNDLNLSTSSQQILNFLIVDDSNPNRKVMRRLLNSLGHQVSEAKNGAEFVECMKDFYNSDAERVECPYDIILVDDHMPIMNGPTAIREVRALGFSGIIIGVTGNTEDEDIERFISHGANEVLAKPLNLDTLRTSISALLKR